MFSEELQTFEEGLVERMLVMLFSMLLLFHTPQVLRFKMRVQSGVEDNEAMFRGCSSQLGLDVYKTY